MVKNQENSGMEEIILVTPTPDREVQNVGVSINEPVSFGSSQLELEGFRLFRW